MCTLNKEIDRNLNVKTEMTIITINSVPIWRPIRLRLKLVLVAGNRRLATDPLQLALDVVRNMRVHFVIFGLIIVDHTFGSRRFTTREGRLEVASVANGAAGGGAADAGSSAAPTASGSGEDVVEVVGCGGKWRSGGLWETAVNSVVVRTGTCIGDRIWKESLPSVMDDLGDETRPPTLMGGSKTSTCVSVEELVEPHIVFPVLVKIEQVGVVVDCAASFVVPRKQMLHSVLKLLCNLS